MSVNVSIEEAFAESCQLLGAAMVREALLAKKVAELNQQVAGLSQQLEANGQTPDS